MHDFDIEKIASLAKLDVSESKYQLSEAFTQILHMFEVLKGIDTSNVTPLHNPLDEVARLREDKVVHVDNHKLYQQNSVSHEDGFYLVPKVIE